MREIVRAYVSGNGDAASAMVLHEDGEHGALAALSVMRIFQHAQNGDGRVGLATLEFIAPAPDTSARFEAWTALAEGQSLIAAGRGARHTLAEAPEDSQEVDALLAAGFSPWMHQDALKMAGAPAGSAPDLAPWLREMSGEADEASARWLSARVVPKPLQRAGATTISSDWRIARWSRIWPPPRARRRVGSPSTRVSALSRFERSFAPRPKPSSGPRSNASSRGCAGAPNARSTALFQASQAGSFRLWTRLASPT